MSIKRKRHKDAVTREESTSEIRRRRGHSTDGVSGMANRQTVTVKGRVIEADAEDVVIRRKSPSLERKRISNKPVSKRRKSKFPEVDLEQFKEPMMSTAMCEACKNKDVRAIQDNFNIVFLTLNAVARELGVIEENWKRRMKALRDWANERQAHKLSVAQKRATDKMVKQAIRKTKGGG